MKRVEQSRFRPTWGKRGARFSLWNFTLVVAGLLIFVVALRGNELRKRAKPTPIQFHVKSVATNELANANLENTFWVTANIYSGGSPETEADFQALFEAGIRTIISVDGQPPKVELARKNGIKYLHLPMGYGAISTKQSQKIVQAVASSAEPVFLHCHHGKHRGPAAVGIACRALHGWSPEETEAWLKQAGISPGYIQMIESACQLPVPTAEEISGLNFQLTESVPPALIVERMLKVDEHFDLLKNAATKLAAKSPLNDKEKVNKKILSAAILAREELQELSRNQSLIHNGNFIAILGDSIAELEVVESLVTPPEGDRTQDILIEKYQTSLKRLGETCTRCHQKFRDNPTPSEAASKRPAP